MSNSMERNLQAREDLRNRNLFRSILLRFKCAILDGRLTTSFDADKDTLFIDTLCENYSVFPKHEDDHLGI